MIEDLKLLLGMEDTDKKTEQQLQLILNATKQRLKFLLGGLEPPEEMEYIILDVSVIRFNRIVYYRDWETADIIVTGKQMRGRGASNTG